MTSSVVGPIAATMVVNDLGRAVVFMCVVPGRVVGTVFHHLDLGRMVPAVVVRAVLDGRAHVRKGDSPFQGLYFEAAAPAVPVRIHTAPPMFVGMERVSPHRGEAPSGHDIRQNERIKIAKWNLDQPDLGGRPDLFFPRFVAVDTLGTRS